MSYKKKTHKSIYNKRRPGGKTCPIVMKNNGVIYQTGFGDVHLNYTPEEYARLKKIKEARE